jgi:hypothetical protein
MATRCCTSTRLAKTDRGSGVALLAEAKEYRMREAKQKNLEEG